MKTYKVYYINLDKSVDRKEFMENQFKKLNVPIERISAVYGKELPSYFLRNAKKQFKILTHFPNLNDGEIGLTKTYFDLWKKISVQKEDFSIILEDDSFIKNIFFKDLPNLLAQITTNDYVDISGRKGLFSLEKTKYLTKYTVPALGTTGQIIGKLGAKKLIENLTTFYAPIDVLKQDVFRHKVKVFSTNKAYIVSNDKNVGGSTIQQKDMPKIKKVIREIIRPFWQLLTLFTFKLYRAIRNYVFYKTVK